MIRFAITDRKLYPGSEKEQQAALVAQAARLSAAGVDFLQVREKDLSREELIQLARQIVEALRSGSVVSQDAIAGSAIPNRAVISTEAQRSGEICSSPAMRVLLNGDVETALLAGAHGVHLTSQLLHHADTQPRLLARSHLYVSTSCHAQRDIERALQLAVDAILFGPVFGKNVRSEDVQPGVGLESLAAAVRAAGNVPVIALGGITPENAQACIDAGAAGIAGIRMFL